MSLVTNLTTAFTSIGTAIKGVKTTIGTLASLTTTDKSSLVAAVNEVKAGIPAPGVSINDAAPTATTTTYSASKIESVATAAASAAASALVNGAGSTVDTLKEIADLLTTDESTASALATTVASKVSQTRTVAGHALTTDVTLAVADISGAQASSTIGDTTHDFAGDFTAALV